MDVCMYVCMYVLTHAYLWGHTYSYIPVLWGPFVLWGPKLGPQNYIAFK